MIEPQELSFQEQISFEAKQKESPKTNETKEQSKNQSIFTKTENNNHSIKSSGQFDKKDSIPNKTYKLELKTNDNNKNFGNPFNKNQVLFNNNQNNIKNNIVLINNSNESKNHTSNQESKDTTININSKDSKNSNILKKHESVSQFYNN